MNSAATWKSLTVGAAMAGFSFFGVAIAEAAPPPPWSGGITGSTEDCTSGGAGATRCQTNGSTAIRTAPRAAAESRVYGPYISRDMIWIVAD